MEISKEEINLKHKTFFKYLKAHDLKIKQNNRGITLVALVVTIIVLLILAGVSLVMIFNSEGLFSRATGATYKYNRQKAEETLELILRDAQLMKYGSEGLTNEQLNEKLNEIGQIDEEDDSLVTVDKYIFEIDRNVPKILRYVGESDEIILKYKILGNDNWVKTGEANITVNITVKDNGGALKGDTIRVSKDGTDITSTIINVTTGIFTLTTTESTIYVINVENNKGEQSTPRTIKVNAKIDNTAPTITAVNALAEGMDIKISAEGYDINASGQVESGVRQFNYKISSTEDTKLEGIPTDKRMGKFEHGETITITSTKEATYTITVTAEDNVGNQSIDHTSRVATINGLTIAQAKEKVNSETLQRYIGTKITDYNPDIGGTWRILYYDSEGYFGTAGKLYLKRDFDNESYLRIQLTVPTTPTNNGEKYMRLMNPKWRESSYSEALDIQSKNAISWMCDSDNWSNCIVQEKAEYAIGGASVEMFIRAYNKWKSNDESATGLICEIGTNGGYRVGINGKYLSNSAEATGESAYEPGPGNIFLGWMSRLCSPSNHNKFSTLGFRRCKLWKIKASINMFRRY